MAQATFSVRMDETLKKEFDVLCQDFGMSATTAINIFARTVVKERRIPFEICAADEAITRKGAQAVFEALRAQAAKNGAGDMTLEEINEEIDRARREADQ